jgi:photosystem II stability/assembly factor-like uncharacterized protein
LFGTLDGGRQWQQIRIAGAGVSAITALAAHESGWVLAGGVTDEGDLVLTSRIGDGEWHLLDPAASAHWGTDQRYRKWFIGQLLITSEQEAWANIFQGFPKAGVLLHTQNGGKTWSERFSAPVDLHHLFFAANAAWLAADDGRFWKSEDGGKTWDTVTISAADGVTPSQVVIRPDGEAGIAPLWRGKVLTTSDGSIWRSVSIDDFGYSMPDAAITERDIFVLSADGRFARARAR